MSEEGLEHPLAFPAGISMLNAFLMENITSE